MKVLQVKCYSRRQSAVSSWKLTSFLLFSTCCPLTTFSLIANSPFKTPFSSPLRPRSLTHSLTHSPRATNQQPTIQAIQASNSLFSGTPQRLSITRQPESHPPGASTGTGTYTFTILLSRSIKEVKRERVSVTRKRRTMSTFSALTAT